MSRAANNIRSTHEKPSFFRKAGERIREFDDQYSQKIQGMYKDAGDGVYTAAALVGGASPSFRKFDAGVAEDAGRMERVLGNAMTYGVPIANAVPKYVLPATGVTLAGKALVDIASGLGQQTEGTLIV